MKLREKPARAGSIKNVSDPVGGGTSGLLPAFEIGGGGIGSLTPSETSSMSKSDFFSFITKLKPIELKAIGELSQVMHLEEGITVYQCGDASDALYIINRGALQVMHGGERREL